MNKAVPKIKLSTPNGETKVLLHACCAPCSSAIIEAMVQNGIAPHIYFFNPNIYPKEEYLKRKNEIWQYAARLGLEITDGDYNYTEWRKGAVGMENMPERSNRCQYCFNMRMLRSAKFAAQHGITLFTTTLASSRWKDFEQILSAGRYAASQVEGVTFWEQNWRKGGLYERRNQLLKIENFYNQQYCGCEFSAKRLEGI